MMESLLNLKITASHLARKAIVYLRQSSDAQVKKNLESKRLQYALVERAQALGWKEVEVVDLDLGRSASLGAAARAGFDSVIASVALAEVGIIFSRELSRLFRTDKDFCHLMEVCGLFDCLLGDEEQVYDLNVMDDQLVLGIKGTLSVVELKVLKLRMEAGMKEKARRGELARLLAARHPAFGDFFPGRERHDGAARRAEEETPWFGIRGSQVQILPPRPIEPIKINS